MNIIKYSQLGTADYGWLNAHYHFSFARYYNPKRMGFGVLRVINDDIIAPESGFAPHPHDNMEIITYVRRGAISHEDSQGNKGKTTAGDVQVMSAGTGIVHSEYNLESEETELYQIWIEPNIFNVEPRWDQKEFPKKPVAEKLTLIVSGDAKANALFIHQNIKIYAGKLNQGHKLIHNSDMPSYVLISKGRIELNSAVLNKGDAAEFNTPTALEFKALEEAEVLVIEVPTF